MDEKIKKDIAISQLVLPCIAIAMFLFLSYFKYDLIDHFGGIRHRSVLIYHAIRLIFFGIYIVTLFQTTILLKIPVIKESDTYEELRKKYDPLLGLRAAAFLMVFLGHWFMVVFSPYDMLRPDGDLILRFLMSASPWGGVWFFFTLSGYLMGKSCIIGRYAPNNIGIKLFYRNRALRIIPLYLISVFLVALLQKPEFFGFANSMQLDSFLSELLFDSHGHGAIGALWSVSTEVQFYIAIPFIYILTSRYLISLKRVLIVSGIIFPIIIAIKTYLVVGWPSYWHTHIYFPFIANIDCFFAGYVSAVIVSHLRKRQFYMSLGIRVGVIIAFIYYIILSYASYVFMAQEYTPHRLIYLGLFPGLTAIVTSIIIILFESSERIPPSNRFISQKGWLIQSSLGALTYSLYVWHEPVILSIRKIFKTTITFGDALTYLPIGFFLCVCTAFIFYEFFEKKFDTMRSLALKK